MKEIVGEYANITCHTWREDGDYFGFCTDLGQVMVYQVGSEIVLEHHYEDKHFVAMAIFELGLAVASADGCLIFYELN